MRINRYCKFLIYLQTNLILGAVFFGIIASIWSGISGQTNIHDALLASFKFFLTALGVWFISTALLLVIGFLYAPKDEKQTNMGEKALGASIGVYVIAGGVFFGGVIGYEPPLQKELLAFFVLAAASFLGLGIIRFSLWVSNAPVAKSVVQPIPQKPRRMLRKGMPPEGRGPMIFCSKCLKKTPEEEVFCRFCGRKLR